MGEFGMIVLFIFAISALIGVGYLLWRLLRVESPPPSCKAARVKAPDVLYRDLFEKARETLDEAAEIMTAPLREVSRELARGPRAPLRERLYGLQDSCPRCKTGPTRFNSADKTCCGDAPCPEKPHHHNVCMACRFRWCEDAT